MKTAAQTTSEGTSSDDPRKLWCLLESDDVIMVNVKANDQITILKQEVHHRSGSAYGEHPKDLVLYKVGIPFDGRTKRDLGKLRIPENAILIDSAYLPVFDIWPVQPPDMIHIFVKSTAAAITASLSTESNLAAYNAPKRPHPDDPDDLDRIKRAQLVDDDAWLTELHGKIWGRGDRWQELHHTVEVTAAHYHELQERLNKLCPDRHAREYQAHSEGVLSTKLGLLRDFKPPSVAPAPGHATHADNEQVENDDDEPRSLFPFTLEYLDLSCLELEDTTSRMPLAFLIRDEYKFLSKILDKLNGSGIVSGQPGTGKTAYLYIRMVYSMISGSPFLYQSLGGTVYHVANAITTITSWHSGNIVAYVDTDEKKFEPQRFIRRPWIKIIADSSPKDTDQPWMSQMANNEFPIPFTTALWTESELLVTGIFLHPQDLTYTRLKEATTYFGFSPRLCFRASVSVRQLRHLQNRVQLAVEKAALKRDIGSLVVSFQNSIMLSHTIFELSPRDDDRLFGDALVGTVSPWALDLLLGAYETQKSDAAAEFYDSIANMPKAEGLRGRIFERQVLKYLDNLEVPCTFSIRSLEDSTTTKWVYPGPAKRHGFLPTTFAEELLSVVKDKKPLHLVPKENFPALDSVIYDPRSGLTHAQVTTRVDHPVDVSGLKRIQGYLKRNTPLADLRSSIRHRHWPLIFIVPDTISDSFKKQPFEGDTFKQEWANKVHQYVLGIKEESLWAKTR